MSNAVQSSSLVTSEALRPTRGSAGRIVRNFLFLGAGKAGNLLLSFLVVTWLARKLRPEGFGLISFALALMSYFIVLAQGGLPLLGVREVSREPRRAAHYVRHIQGLQIVQSVLAFLLMLGVAFLAPRSRLEKEILILFSIPLLLYPFQLDWVLQGIERMGLLAAITFIQGAVYVSLVIWKVHSSEAVIWVPVAFLIGTVVQDVLLTTSIFRRFGIFLPSFDPHSLRSDLRTSLPMGFSIAMVVVYWNTGSVLLGFLKGNAQVGWYNAAIKIVMVVLVVPQLYNQAMVPSISGFFVQSLPRLERLIAESIRLMAFLAVPIMAGGIFLARKIIYFLYGIRYEQSAVCLQIVFVAVAIIYVNLPMGSLVIFCGREKVFMVAAMIAALVNVGANLFLIPWMGIKGAAAATVLCELILSALLYHGANQLIRVRVLTSLWRPLLACFPMMLALALSRNMALAWQVLLGALVYLVAVALLGGLKKEDFRIAASMVQSKGLPVA